MRSSGLIQVFSRRLHNQIGILTGMFHFPLQSCLIFLVSIHTTCMDKPLTNSVYSRSKLMESNCRPLLFYLDDRIILNFAPEPLKGVKGVSRAEGLPELSPSQLAALNMVQTCAKNCELVLDLQPGDMTFINNHAILHSRDAFRDSAEQQRHIVRLWLQNQSLAWRLPEQLKQGNRRIYDQNEIMESWNIAPTPRLVFSLSERLCS